MKTNLTCEACERELNAFLDGMLHPAVARAIESHVESCAGCRAKLAAYRSIAAALAELPEIAAPVWLEARVLRAVPGKARTRVIWHRGLAGAGALSFAASIGLVAVLPKIAKALGLPDPLTWPVLAVRALLEVVVAVSKRLALDVVFWEPIARRIWTSFTALESIPRAVFLSFQTPEVQLAGAVLITLGVAIFWALRPSRTHEGGVGHVCLTL